MDLFLSGWPWFIASFGSYALSQYWLGKRDIHMHVFVVLALSGIMLFALEEWSLFFLLHDRLGRFILLGLNIPLLVRAFSGMRVSWGQETSAD